MFFLRLLLAISLAFANTVLAEESCENWLLARDQAAVAAMRAAVTEREAGANTVLSWLSFLRRTITAEPASLLEHLALVTVVKSGVFQTHPQAEVRNEIEKLLSLSFRQITGVNPTSPQASMMRLPSSILARASFFENLAHEAVFSDQPSYHFVFAPKSMSLADFMGVFGSALAICFESGRWAVLGGLIGLAQASANEYMVHIGIGHAPSKRGRLFRKFGRAGEFMEQVTLAHRLHHAVVSITFGAAVLTEEQRRAADKILVRLAESLVLDRLRDGVRTDDEIRADAEFRKNRDHIVQATQRGNYGVNGTMAGAGAMLVSSTPLFLMNYLIYKYSGSSAFLVSSQASLTFMILQSLYSHRYLHLRPEDENQKWVNKLQVFYVKKTFLGRLARVLHYTHHEYPFDPERTKNGVIMAGSIFDRFWGKFGNPRLSDLIKMHQEGWFEEDQ